MREEGTLLSGLNRRAFFGRLAAAAGGGIIIPAACSEVPRPSREVVCSLYSSVPESLMAVPRPCGVGQPSPGEILLHNHFLEVTISARQGTVNRIRNRLNGEITHVEGDMAGIRATSTSQRKRLTWFAASGRDHSFEMNTQGDPEREVRLVLREPGPEFTVAVVYRLGRDSHWVERQLSVEEARGHWRIEELVYGRLCPLGETVPRTLELGRFDRPRLYPCGEGGLFAGVGWWFYSVSDDGKYANDELSEELITPFISEPWYLGIFQDEPGEPFSGWLWYRSFLEKRKANQDSRHSFSYWNAGWGQWGIDIDDPTAASYIELSSRLGIEGIAFGGGLAGKGLREYIRLVTTSETARENLRLAREKGLLIGFLDTGNLGKRWEDRALLDDKQDLLAQYAEAGFGTLHFDFFSTIDSYRAHRNVARYFAAARNSLAYTECHLGMAAYGPQFQREVLVNHPSDLENFDLSHFSSDWSTFLGFRASRREWQQRYDYLIPENSLYYFATHYSNWGNPRRYQDPEPQQLLYGPHAYCGLAYNFHDYFGYRDSIAAISAFTPFLVFGHLDLNMSESERTFTARYLEWIRSHADLLSLGRVCFEDDAFCVISKLRGAEGLVFLINYQPLHTSLQLEPAGSDWPPQIRQVYPSQMPIAAPEPGQPLEIEVGGESVTILEFGTVLTSLPPVNLATSSQPLAWVRSGESWTSTAKLEPTLMTPPAGLPKKIVSTDVNARLRSNLFPQLGRGPLPDHFLEVYGAGAGGVFDTWKLAPWALPERVFLVCRPDDPVPFQETPPSLLVNGEEVFLAPRVDYRPADVASWVCPLWYADITEQALGAGRVELELLRLSYTNPNSYLIWRKGA